MCCALCVFVYVNSAQLDDDMWKEKKTEEPKKIPKTKIGMNRMKQKIHLNNKHLTKMKKGKKEKITHTPHHRTLTVKLKENCRELRDAVRTHRSAITWRIYYLISSVSSGLVWLQSYWFENKIIKIIRIKFLYNIELEHELSSLVSGQRGFSFNF